MSVTFLDADLTFYVDWVNGHDANDGLTPATAKKTRLAIYDWAQANVFMSGHRIGVFMIGASPETCTLAGPIAGQKRAEDFYFSGYGGPLNCTLTPPPGAATFECQEDARFAVLDATLNGPLIGMAGTIKAGGVWFGPQTNPIDLCGPTAIFAGIGALTWLPGVFSIGVKAEDGALIELGCPLVISGGPSFGVFAQSDISGIIDASGSTVSRGAATGVCAAAYGGGWVFTGGTNNLMYFPGNIPAEVKGGYYE